MLYFRRKTLLSFKSEVAYSRRFQHVGEKCLSKIPALGAGAQVLAAEGAAGVASKGRGHGLPCARHSPSQWTHYRAQLSSLPPLVVLLGKSIQERA